MNTHAFPWYLAAGGLVLVISIGVGGWYAYDWSRDRTVPITVTERVERPALELGFSYPSGPDGYSLIEPPVEVSTSTGTSTEAQLIGAFLLMYTPDYIDFQSRQDEAGETPPSISLFVYDAPETLPGDVRSRDERLLDWARSNRTLTMIPEEQPTEVELDSVDAFTYTSDGLYQQRVYLVSHSGNYYLLVGQFNEPGDRYYTAFDELISSVLFF